MRLGEKVALSECQKVSKRRITVSTGIPRHQEYDWEMVSLSLTAGKGRRAWQSISTCLLPFSPPPFSILSCHLCYPIQSNCLPLFHLPAPLNTYTNHFTPLFVFISYFPSSYLLICNTDNERWSEVSLNFICMPG